MICIPLTSLRPVPSQVRALARLEYQPDIGWFDRLVAVSEPLLGHLGPVGLSDLLASVVYLSYTPPEGYVDSAIYSYIQAANIVCRFSCSDF